MLDIASRGVLNPLIAFTKMEPRHCFLLRQLRY